MEVVAPSGSEAVLMVCDDGSVLTRDRSQMAEMTRAMAAMTAQLTALGVKPQVAVRHDVPPSRGRGGRGRVAIQESWNHDTHTPPPPNLYTSSLIVESNSSDDEMIDILQHPVTSPLPYSASYDSLSTFRSHLIPEGGLAINISSDEKEDFRHQTTTRQPSPHQIRGIGEVGNVPYVVENGCGKFSKSPKEIARIVADWFGSKSEELRAMSQNCMKLARPDAVFKIVHDLHELVRHRNLAPQIGSLLSRYAMVSCQTCSIQPSSPPPVTPPDVWPVRPIKKSRSRNDVDQFFSPDLALPAKSPASRHLCSRRRFLHNPTSSGSRIP
ncbi:putative monogalactosyldiacylglycerol synthase, chloroplastic [Dendrobium catenatum]|uniref:Putative monogalactosyldiacylglycerol synthase, chloroplastic n=1 Tax=Dendrobium catenatum TaxID=906689 RepID=A0A2I0W7Y3_9ASPA|nr:putative monogalactosyldiacylglycerol synthase, chloroplastic [Dendrobium catenatum]